MTDTTDANEPECEQNAATQSVVTESTSVTTGAVIEIVPMIDPMLEVKTEASVPDPNTGTQPPSVVTGASDTNMTGETRKVQTNTQQRISEDYTIPEEIASAALLKLQDMSQPNPQEPDDNDEYALPVGTERLPDSLASKCQVSVERIVLDQESEAMRGLGSIPTGGNILSLDYFHVVKPLVPILALLPISSSL